MEHVTFYKNCYGISEGRCFPCSGTFGRAALSTYSCNHCCKHFPNVKILLKKNMSYDTKRMSFACMASTSSHRRNPDFSRQSRQGDAFSRNKNRPNQEKANNSESIDGTEFLSSRNGPLLSLSGSPRFQATATPGPREREIVELFRKVQAQLRERAAIKEERKIEASQGQGERGTVDSLLNLLRKHSSEQGKKSNSSEDFNLDPSGRNNNFDDEQNLNFFDSDTITTEEEQEPRATPFSRPASNFWRKSPVPKIKYQSVYSTNPTEESIDSSPSSKLQSKVNRGSIQPDPESVSDAPNDGAIDEISESLEPDEASDESDEPMSTGGTDLGSLKLSELRVLAKSRGVKGFSRLKKGELLELLSKYSG